MEMAQKMLRVRSSMSAEELWVLEDVFEKFDVDKSGFLTVGELTEAINYLGRILTLLTLTLTLTLINSLILINPLTLTLTLYTLCMPYYNYNL